MIFKISTPDGRTTLRTCALRGGRRPIVRHPANDAAHDEAAALLHKALTRLDASGNFIAAAYVDQALSSLRVERQVGEGG